MAGNLSPVSRDVISIADNPDLNDDVLRNLNAFMKYKEAFADNTWQQLMKTTRLWCHWCIAKGRPYLPVDPDYLRDYLWELHESGLAPATLSNYAAMLNLLHRQAGLIPAGDSQKVKRILKKIHRVAVVNGEKEGQAIPFRIDDLNRIDTAWNASAQLKDSRNLAFLFVAYNTLLRVSNLARLKVRDVIFNRDGSIMLHIGYTKTQVDGQGLTKALSPRASARLREWLQVSGLTEHAEAYVFCQVHRSNQTVVTTEKPMDEFNLSRIFSTAWTEVHGDKKEVANKPQLRLRIAISLFRKFKLGFLGWNVYAMRPAAISSRKPS
uniref:tyrosine-type recombinase/integrase n=1 Tax=Xenorhabdus sp. Sc-CR9 TaxID=2584468 RepID=UPI001F01DF49|nr:tyrosine-type recombinase/integrase [Xenorhabdus sp. Sc-CR9]